jgi:hypothetical protein
MSDAISSISSIGSSYVSKKQNGVLHKIGSDSDSNIKNSGNNSGITDSNSDVSSAINKIDSGSDSIINSKNLKSAMPSLGAATTQPADDKKTMQTSEGSDASKVTLANMVDSLNASSTTSGTDEAVAQQKNQLLQVALSSYKAPVTNNQDLIDKGISLMKSGLYA